MADALTSDARFLVERCPAIVNILAAQIGDRFIQSLIRSEDFDLPRTRLGMLRELPVVSLAEFLERELGDGIPTDWRSWLLEECAE